ncbi:hypothetical protein H4P12_02430 [Paracoccus sp. 11-3]|uniref:Uncharacterized protein n=1 Tax=Paracoccus amoyensis TaxID=2760093 RepID=A0A926GED9_9RHOB|nr:hypothetical protein [Paracoccus amoyensis]MBC9245592.1 hypothetical protein [Paracoccus amoyensis]
MIQKNPVYRFIMTFLALLGTFVIYGIMAMLHYMAWTGQILPLDAPYAGGLFLFGVPTFGGAPIGIHVFNHALWGIPAALAYAVFLRIMLGGSIHWLRLLCLYVATVAMGYIFAMYDWSGILRPGEALLWAYGLWFLVGLLIVRDWVVRP